MGNIPGIAPNSKWLGLGYSMGHIVLLAYMSCFPNRFVGYVNNDGLPNAFVSLSKVFLDVYAPIYKVYGLLAKLGFMRCMLKIGPIQTWLQQRFVADPFTTHHIVAQMSQSAYWSGVVREFYLMMSCSELVTACLGCLSPLRMDRRTFSLMCRVKPNHTIRVDEVKGLKRQETPDERSPFELGRSYLDDNEQAAIINTLREMARNESISQDVDLQTCFSDRKKPAVGTRAGGLGDGDKAYWLYPQLVNMTYSSLIARGPMGPMWVNEYAYGQHMRNLNQLDHTVSNSVAKCGKHRKYLDLHHGDLCPAQPGELVLTLRELIDNL